MKSSLFVEDRSATSHIKYRLLYEVSESSVVQIDPSMHPSIRLLSHLASCRSCTPCSKKDRGGDGLLLPLLLLPWGKCSRVVVSTASESVDFRACSRPLSGHKDGLLLLVVVLFTFTTGTHIVWIRGKSLRGMTFDRFQHSEP